MLPPLDTMRQESSARRAFGGGPHPRRLSPRYSLAAPRKQADPCARRLAVMQDERNPKAIDRTALMA